MSNFSFLEKQFPLLAELGEKAEQYLYTDPNTTMFKLRSLGEKIVELMFQYDKEMDPTDHTQVARIRWLSQEDYLPWQEADSLTILRKLGNKAVHDDYASLEDAKLCLKVAYSLCQWFMVTYGDYHYQEQPFVMPLEMAAAPVTLVKRDAAPMELTPEEEKLSRAASEKAKNAPKVPKKQRVQQNIKASNYRNISEAETRYLIDQQLRQVGWEVDSREMTYARGTRPANHHNRAIAEWPTNAFDGTDKDGRRQDRADYALFIGKKLVGIIEAKRRFKNVSSVLDDQCHEYAAHIRAQDKEYVIDTWGEYKVPFLFASNGRPYIEQCRMESGIWFRDVRKVDNAPKPLLGWMSPEGLEDLLKQDISGRNKKLASLGDDILKDPDGLHLYPYQIEAVKRTEEAIRQGKDRILLAMATGTGKTRVILALMYRFLKSGRFHRILYLVDRNTLGKQAFDKFSEVKLEGLQSLNQLYTINRLDETELAPEVKVQIATVQGMIRRLFQADEEDTIPSVSAFDLVIVDEAHRGYVLDRELTEGELLYRDEKAFQSQYRRVLDYFDAVRIGLTATPALQTTEIFGMPIYRYTYREAVIDGYLIDHDAPVQIETEMTRNGIHLKKGDTVHIFRPDIPEKVDTAVLDDDMNFDVDDMNRKVITEDFNRVVLTEIAKYIDPSSPRMSGKTLIFAANDRHADLVVQLLKEIFTQKGVDNDAIVKITGTSFGGDRSKIDDAIKRFKNEDYPSVVVTVDLLTTGVDVPSITNLVFLRRVKSRILFEQMLGRATRRCDEIGKYKFNIFDAVGEFAEMAKVTDMKPVAAGVKTTFKDLFAGLHTVTEEGDIRDHVDQILVKLQRKLPRLKPEVKEVLLQGLGERDVKEYVHHLRKLPLEKVKAELLQKEKVFTTLDKPDISIRDPHYIVHIPDKVIEVKRGYGKDNTAIAPRDYLDEFTEFIKSNENEIAALKLLCTRPRDMKRRDLKQLRTELAREGFTEQKLNSALQQVSSQDMLVDLISLVRRAALGSPLVSHEERVRRAMEKLRKNHAFSQGEKNWLKRIEKILQTEDIFNRDNFEEDERLKSAGGFRTANKAFGNKLENILDELNDYLYDDDDRNGGHLA